MTNILNRVFPVEDLKDTVMRFPLSVVCAGITFIVALLGIHDIFDIDEDIIGRVVTTTISLYLWFGIVILIAESRKFKTTLAGFPFILVAIGIVFLLTYSSLYWIHFALLLPTLLLGVIVAPYLKGGDDWSFWLFNRNLWLGVALSFLAALLFAAGFSLALVAVDHLFGVDIDEKMYSDIWLFASVILGPVYALSRVPKKFDYDEAEVTAPAGLRFIANWVFVPVVFVYLLILYAYFAKIVISAEVPNGWLAWLITGFVGSGVVTYLIAWPLRGSKEGLPHLQLFYKIFFPALFIPIGFHFFAIWERVSAYGITEQRYMLMISAFWFLIIAITKSLPFIPLRIIPASLFLLMALASFGPWGAVSVSGASQINRLEGLLNKYELLEDGRVVKLKDGGEIPFDDRLSISSILDYMCRSDRDAMIEPWFNAEDKKDWSCSANDLTNQLGFEYVNYRFSDVFSNTRFYVYVDQSSGRPNVVDVKDYDLFIKNMYVSIHGSNDDVYKEHVEALDRYSIDFSFSGDELRVSVAGHAPVVVDVVDYIKDKTGQSVLLENMFIIGENADLSYKVIFYSIRGEIKNGKPFPVSMGFDFLFRIKNE